MTLISGDRGRVLGVWVRVGPGSHGMTWTLPVLGVWGHFLAVGATRGRGDGWHDGRIIAECGGSRPGLLLRDAPGPRLCRMDSSSRAREGNSDVTAGAVPAEWRLVRLAAIPTAAELTSLSVLGQYASSVARRWGLKSVVGTRIRPDRPTSRTPAGVEPDPVAVAEDAIGPPSTASGVDVANAGRWFHRRTGRRSATSLPSPAPLIAPVMAKHFAHRAALGSFVDYHGVAHGNGAILRASSAARSPSKTLRGAFRPSESNPAVLTTAPSGCQRSVQDGDATLRVDQVYNARSTLPSGSGG